DKAQATSGHVHFRSPSYVCTGSRIVTPTVPCHEILSILNTTASFINCGLRRHTDSCAGLLIEGIPQLDDAADLNIETIRICDMKTGIVRTGWPTGIQSQFQSAAF